MNSGYRVLLLLYLVGAKTIDAMELEPGGGPSSDGLSEIHLGEISHLVPEEGMTRDVARGLIGTFCAHSLLPQKDLLNAVEQELRDAPELMALLETQKSKRTQEPNEKTLILQGKVLVEILRRTQEQKDQHRDEAERQKQKAQEKKDQLKQEEKKSFCSILAAVGSGVLAVASTAWGAVAATGAEGVVVEVLCNCSLAI